MVDSKLKKKKKNSLQLLKRCKKEKKENQNKLLNYDLFFLIYINTFLIKNIKLIYIKNNVQTTYCMHDDSFFEYFKSS